MTATPVTRNRVPVFGPFTWDNPAPGVWEAAAKPTSPDSRPPYEAVAITNTIDDFVTEKKWIWELYQPHNEPEHGGGLARIATGTAPTLADAQRQADHAARQWRDDERHWLQVGS